jgi:hypothetical protein
MQRKVLGRQGLQVEAALAGFHLHPLLFENEADFRALRQRTQDLLQLAAPTVTAPSPSPLKRRWTS